MGTGKIEHKAQSEEKQNIKTRHRKLNHTAAWTQHKKGGMNPGVHEGRVLFSLLYQL